MINQKNCIAALFNYLLFNNKNNTMRKTLFITLVSLGFTFTNGQVGINTTAPKTTLEIDINTASTGVDGLLIPRVDRERAENMTSIPLSTMIYVNDISTGTQSGVGINIDSVGFYYFDGTSWRPINSTNSPTQGSTVQKLRYLGAPNATKTLIIDGFYEVRFSPITNGFALQLRLLDPPSVNYTIRYNRIGSTTGTNNPYSNSIVFTPANYSTWQNLDTPTGAGTSYMYTGVFSSPNRDKLHEYVLNSYLGDFINMAIKTY